MNTSEINSSKFVNACGTSLLALRLIAERGGLKLPSLSKLSPRDQRSLVIDTLKNAGFDVRGH